MIQRKLNHWDVRFLELACFISQWSKDDSRKVGCVIVGTDRSILAIGYNGFPRGISDEKVERVRRPAKYVWTEHAERNAIYQAARNGIALAGSTMYLPWFPCVDCARAIVQAGIARLVAIRPGRKDARWDEHFATADTLFREAKVQVIFAREDFSPRVHLDLVAK